MKKECAVVQDLLVLYEDDVLKEESKQMIEEHIRGCEECMRIYEDAGKKLPDIEGVPEASENEHEMSTIRIIKRMKKRITHRTMITTALLACMILIIAETICSRITDSWNGSGVTALFSLISTKNIHVSDLYQLKNGDIYCTLDFDKGFTSNMIADWVIPYEMQGKSTDEAVKELRFKRELWELDSIKIPQLDIIFSLTRQGNIEGSDKTITQSCSEINIYGKTLKDKFTIWKAGQKVEEAPENIEKEAIQTYAKEGQIEKAIEECENMGWDDYEKLIGDTDDMEKYEIYPSITFTDKDNSIMSRRMAEE